MRDVSDRVVEKIEIQCMFGNLFCENRAVCEIMWKNVVQATMTVWHMRFACHITEATDLHSEYGVLITFPPQQWLHERASVLCYTYIACPFFWGGGRCCPNRTRPPRFEVSESRTVRHIHPVGLLRATDRVAEVATYTAYNKHKRRSSMPLAGFEPAIPSTKRLHTPKRPHDLRYRHLFLRTIKRLPRNLGKRVNVLFSLL